MAPVEIRRCAFAEIEHAPGLAGLMAEYDAESAMPELAPHSPQFATYRALEQMDTAHTIGAFQGKDLVGFLIVLVAVLPHFGRRVASTESFFVAQSVRKSGAGLHLLREAERLAQEQGAEGFFVSAPVGGRLESVMPKAGYRQASAIFFRSLPCTPQ